MPAICDEFTSVVLMSEVCTIVSSDRLNKQLEVFCSD